MSSGPCHSLVVSRQEGSDDVIPAWREFIGPADTEEARRNKPERCASEREIHPGSAYTRTHAPTHAHTQTRTCAYTH